MDDVPGNGVAGDGVLPPGLKFLKALVIVLTLTMIGGVITVVGLLVTRMPQMARAPVLPEALTLPQGTQAAAVTAGNGWFAVVTTDDRILIYDRNGEMLQEIAIQLPLDP